MSLRGPPEDRSPAELLAFGVVALDKPPGPSSHQVSGWIRDAVADALEDADAATTVEKAAHAGTLDPKVTGCLPVMLGTATRLAPVFLEGKKEYVTVLECHAPVPADAEAVIAEFEGEIYQKPPRKSAVARRLRTREIHALELLETDDRQALVRIRCESGTYVRKLCHDLGLALGTGAHMGDLRRTATEPFDDRELHSAYDLVDALAFWLEDDDPGPLYDAVEPAERILADLPAVTIAESAAREVANGAPVYAPGVLEADPADCDDLVACFTPNDAAVCLGRLVGDPDADSGTVVDLERVLV
ncbi:RNA-guided pseudouridylation complex pseudouridine synthase subunit Cbf5 [Natrialbaceae archaeon AArc-T1-2]|uniref:RNA-guided pseudouridylation complex pseudouridine synthase subunit Cbf5 n=1 Tax=Natrialbaceae archaeon AArc-T1-2 TaxID=3053904 RepID=UPI00255A8985|nr:RNA-guided pseudouridylation complex pseudouridine synthase subunit Cbf5 [Natrialbaceae archaeon AArc-T1-2]WIV67939.1 RNA-guided pseudouridylation complex pseudouridine synthase subunit Cbf5 [Natrialbaceae archaeon AArc-T1-2]